VAKEISMTHKLVLVLLLFATGCITIPGSRPEDAGDTTGLWTSVQHRGHTGSGAVVGKNLIATVSHVVRNSSLVWVSGGLPAKEVERIATQGYEEIVILRVSYDFDDEHIFKLGNGQPHEIWGPRGRQPWSPSEVIPGDSGSPVLDKDGLLVGHVSARSCAMCSAGLLEVYDDQQSIMSGYPADFDLERIRKLDK
jgi:hypothetical protein